MKKVECKNPIATELKKNNNRRYGSPAKFKKIKKDGLDYCAWCGEGRVRGNQKYCTQACKDNCYAFTGPQSPEGLEYHLQEQEFKCAGCGFDYNDLIKEMNTQYSKRNIVHYTPDGRAARWFFDKLRYRVEIKYGKDKSPEVDHIIPIALGGESIGFDNHQVLCHECHKNKTKTDVGDIAKARRDNEL